MTKRDDTPDPSMEPTEEPHISLTQDATNNPGVDHALDQEGTMPTPETSPAWAREEAAADPLPIEAEALDAGEQGTHPSEAYPRQRQQHGNRHAARSLWELASRLAWWVSVSARHWHSLSIRRCWEPCRTLGVSPRPLGPLGQPPRLGQATRLGWSSNCKPGG